MPLYGSDAPFLAIGATVGTGLLAWALSSWVRRLRAAPSFRYALQESLLDLRALLLSQIQTAEFGLRRRRSSWYLRTSSSKLAAGAPRADAIDDSATIDPAQRPSPSPVLLELVATESAYLRDLAMLCDCQQELAEHGLSLGNVSALRLLHSTLANDVGIEPQASEFHIPSVAAVAKAFNTIGPFLKAYADFVLGQYERLSAVEEMRHRGSARKVLAKLQQSHGQPLASLMIKPVQRLCKYPLLLRELLKALPRSTEKEQLVRALALVEAEAAHVNAANKAAEQAFKVVSELGTAPGFSALLAPTRKLRFAADVDALRAHSSPPSAALHRGCRAYVFTDVVIAAEPVRRSVIDKVGDKMTDAFGLRKAKRRSFAGGGGERGGEKWVPMALLQLAGLEVMGHSTAQADAPADAPIRPSSLAGSLLVRGRSSPQLSSTASDSWVTLELLFATAEQAAEFAAEVREAQADFGVQQEGAGQRAKACHDRIVLARFSRRNARSSVQDGSVRDDDEVHARSEHAMSRLT